MNCYYYLYKFSVGILYLLTNPIIIFSILSLILISIKYKKLLIQFNYLYFFLIAKFFVIFTIFFITIYPMPFHLKYSLDKLFSLSGLFLVIIYYFVINFLKDKKIYLLACSIINIGINTNENNRCPRGEIGRHKGLKILALLGVPVRSGRAPLMNKIISDTNSKSKKIKFFLLKNLKKKI